MEDEDTDQDDVTISLKSRDHRRVLAVSWRAAKLSGLITNSVDPGDDESSLTVELLNVEHRVLLKVIEYCEHYADDPMQDIELPFKSHDICEIVQPWYANFVTNLTLWELLELMAAADCMMVIPLVELTFIPLSILLVGKDSNDLRRMFDIPLPTNHRGRFSLPTRRNAQESKRNAQESKVSGPKKGEKN